jgi:hypothetical protein
MAFTLWEFARGALIAWLGFNVLAPVIIAGWSIVAIVASGTFSELGSVVWILLFAPIILLPWSIGALLVLGAPLAFVLGRTLRRTTTRASHFAAFAVLGMVVGVATSIAYTGFSYWPQVTATQTYPTVPTFGEQILMHSPVILLLAVTTAATVTLGWCITATRALRGDARLRQVSDALSEGSERA